MVIYYKIIVEQDIVDIYSCWYKFKTIVFLLAVNNYIQQSSDVFFNIRNKQKTTITGFNS